MKRAKAFLLVCAGVFLLALAYHLGATSAGAQAPGNAVVALTGVGSSQWALTSAGDCLLDRFKHTELDFPQQRVARDGVQRQEIRRIGGLWPDHRCGG